MGFSTEELRKRLLADDKGFLEEYLLSLETTSPPNKPIKKKVKPKKSIWIEV